MIDKNIAIPKIAVLLAACNGEKWITEQILTILNQKNVDLHIYVSIDLSTDNTYDIVAELAQKYHEITLLPYGQRFGGAALNFYHLLLTVPVGKYEYIAFSDQDDIWLVDKLVRAISILKTKDASGYSSNVTAFWENGKEKLIKKDYPQTQYDYLFEGPGPGCTFVLERDIITDVKEYFENRNNILTELKHHDWLIYAFARSRKYRWIIDNKSLLKYRQHNHNQIGVNDGILAFKYRVGEILTGKGMAQVIKMITFLNMENDPFIKKWYKNKKVYYLKLICFSNMFRRNKRDRIFFFFSCLFLFLRSLILWIVLPVLSMYILLR
jgi:rhamnosyltransferase